MGLVFKNSDPVDVGVVWDKEELSRRIRRVVKRNSKPPLIFGNPGVELAFILNDGIRNSPCLLRRIIFVREDAEQGTGLSFLPAGNQAKEK